MKYKNYGECPYCDSERGTPSVWGMNQQVWHEYKQKHDNNHPENEELDETGMVQTNISLTRDQHRWLKDRVKISTAITSMSEIIRQALNLYINGEHNIDSPECWCNPRIEQVPNGNKIIIHNK